MNIRQLFRANRDDNSAAVAKERLQIIIAHERLQRSGPDFLPAMEQDILDVVRKYIAATEDSIHVSLDQQNTYSVLEVNVHLPLSER